jgi:adenylate cyclase
VDTGSDQPRILLLVTMLAVPLLGLGLLVAVPSLDVEWQHNPSHFWLVLIAGGLNAALAYATGAAARRHRDARLFLVSMAFLAAAGFLGLHALATPGVLLSGPNAGFGAATPAGLLIAGGFAAASSLPLEGERGRRVIERWRLIEGLLLAAMAAWAVASLAGTTALNDPTELERASAPMVLIAAAGLGLYGFAVLRYLEMLRRRRATILLGLVVGFVLLAEAMIAVAFGRNWHASWWEWHLLMLAAFGLIAWSAHRQWHEERFGDLLADPDGTPREVSILFADLAGFTSFSENHAPGAVTAMLNAYFDVAIPPVAARWGGRVDRIIGDALMVTFNANGDQPDHARRAAGAALEIQRATARLADQNPGWPRFRIGINTGTAAISLLGTSGGRTRTVIGDAVNVASRLEGRAPAGGIAVSGDTAARLSGATVEPLGELEVKGRDEPVTAFVLRELPGAGGTGAESQTPA